MAPSRDVPDNRLEPCKVRVPPPATDARSLSNRVSPKMRPHGTRGRCHVVPVKRYYGTLDDRPRGRRPIRRLERPVGMPWSGLAGPQEVTICSNFHHTNRHTIPKHCLTCRRIPKHSAFSVLPDGFWHLHFPSTRRAHPVRPYHRRTDIWLRSQLCKRIPIPTHSGADNHSLRQS